MLPLILFDRDESSRLKALACLSECMREHAGRLRLALETGSREEAEKCLAAESGIVALVSEVTREDQKKPGGGAELIRRAFQLNRDSYIVCCLRPGASLETCLEACMRPAGLMSAPPDPRKLRALLERILEDYERVSANVGGDYLVLHSGSSSYRLPLAQVLYIEALDKKLNIWTRRQCISVYETLRDLEGRLGSCFIRPHRSYLVNVAAIELVDYARMTVGLLNGDSIPLSRSCRDAIRKALTRKADGNGEYPSVGVSLL